MDSHSLQTQAASLYTWGAALFTPEHVWNLLLLGVGALLSSGKDIWKYFQGPNSADIENWEAIKIFIPDHFIDYFRNTDMGTPHEQHRLDTLYNADENLKLPRLKFINPNLEKKRQQLIAPIKELSLLTAEHLFSLDRTPNISKIPSETHQRGTYFKIKSDLNNAASKMVIAYDDLEFTMKKMSSKKV